MLLVRPASKIKTKFRKTRLGRSICYLSYTLNANVSVFNDLIDFALSLWEACNLKSEDTD